MIKNRWLLTILMAFLSIPAWLYSQEDRPPTAILEYFDDQNELQIIDKDGFSVQEIYMGMDLDIGDTIQTGETTVEIALDPNGSIIKISARTQFKIENLMGAQGAPTNAFALITGKIRAVAASSGLYTNYEFTTPSAVCGVRGTDLVREYVEGVTDSTAVAHGSVEFTNLATGETTMVNTGMYADVFSDIFQATALSQEQFSSFFGNMDFTELDPQIVPGQTQESTEPDTAEAQPPEDTLADTTPPPPVEPEPEPVQPQPLKNELGDSILRFLGFEIGSIVVNNQTYAKAVVSPKLTLGNFRLGLYLPVIYQNDLFDPAQWYHPQGNNEWSFGTDQKGVFNVLGDFFSDLMLKIKYAQYGDNFDPVYFKIGNLDNMTIGHGMLMRNYANDYEFPAVRKVGLNAGLSGGSIGGEVVVDDIASPRIMGGRFLFKPLYPGTEFGVGLSSIVDIKPDAEDLYGDPLFVNAALDLDLPLGDRRALTLFFDLGAMLPIFRHSVGSIPEGPAWDALLVGGSFPYIKNYGISTGAMGKLLLLDWRLEYRLFDGTFRPAFFNSTYERTRYQYLQSLVNYLNDKNNPAYNMTTMGIYGEAGFDIFKKLYFQAGYFWPWELTDNGVQLSDNDFLHLELKLLPNVIPVVGIHGSIFYDRSQFIPTLLGGDPDTLSLFDANTVMGTEIVYPAMDALDIVFLLTTTVAYDQAGNILYESNGLPRVDTSMSIETRISF